MKNKCKYKTEITVLLQCEKGENMRKVTNLMGTNSEINEDKGETGEDQGS